MSVSPQDFFPLLPHLFSSAEINLISREEKSGSVNDFSVSVVYKSVPPLITSKACQQQVKYVSCSSILHLLCSSKGKRVRETEREKNPPKKMAKEEEDRGRE
jgi:hypothetical protein